MIEFTQFLLPNGRQKTIFINRPQDIESKAEEIISNGYKFECEVLPTGMISLTIANPDEEEDVAIEIVGNGPEVNEAVDRMINGFHKQNLEAR